ncbi:MAG: ammonium transporter [Oscillospiraceae bacterium]|nr:ammonium transporter [Oscillospiraceae bacterium]
MEASLHDIISAVDAFWLFFGGVLVFLMQAGFAMVETGFTRAKNAGNIIMKNLMDFCIGSILYWIIGFGLMFGKSIGGFIGIPGNIMNGAAASGAVDYTTLFFQTVFCATAATIVSGAMAERTQFKSYLIYSAMISLFIYPIAGHWVWGGGWLQQMGFHDFAGSCIVHSCGGVLALAGAYTLGPRIGKYSKNGKVNPIPGHNIVIGSLGVFLLWVGWFGFNPASSGALSDGGYLIAAKTFITTNLAACAAAFSAMIYTWVRYGKPDVSITLNGVLGGLVAITAGCDVVSPLGALIIGIVAGILMTAVIELLDQKLKIDDPVGAVGVHCACGMLGTICVGLFACDGDYTGLFYGGGAKLLGIQCLGQLSICVWAGLLGLILFKILKAATGLRASADEEMNGLDITEHGLVNAYADFQQSYNKEL